MTRKRSNRTRDYIRKAARYIVNYCIEHHIGTIVCGYSGDFKRSMGLGRVTNQQFTQIGFGGLRGTLEGLCERYGIKYIEQEESYTSQASCLDLDEIPVYNPERPYTGVFSGNRVHRGLYCLADGRIANADVNGAANILCKSKQNFDLEELCSGLLASPLRIESAPLLGRSIPKKRGTLRPNRGACYAPLLGQGYPDSQLLQDMLFGVRPYIKLLKNPSAIGRLGSSGECQVPYFAWNNCFNCGSLRTSPEK